MLKPCLLAFVEDLSFQPQIKTIVEAKRGEVYFASEGEQLSQLAKTLLPFMVLVDFTKLDAEWLFKHISDIVSTNPKLPVLVFVETTTPKAVRDRIERYGSRLIILKSELLEQFPDLVEKALRQGL